MEINGIISLKDIKDMDSFINGIDSAILKNEFKNYKPNLLYKDDDFIQGYKYICEKFQKDEVEKKMEFQKGKRIHSHKIK